MPPKRRVRGRGGAAASTRGTGTTGTTGTTGRGVAKGGRPPKGSKKPSKIVILKLPLTPTSPAGTAAEAEATSPMAPNPQEVFEDNLRSTIQTLFTIQSNTHGYLGPETQRALVKNFIDLNSDLQGVSRSSQELNKSLPPELLEYIDNGRNPDIYTREFVELVQQGNRYLKGKSQAFADFRDTLAKDMVEEWPEMKEAVDRVLEGKGKGLDGLQALNGTSTGQADTTMGNK